MAQLVRNPLANAGDARCKGSIPVSGKSPGEGNGNPPQYSCLENPMDRGAWQATVHWVTKSQTWLSTRATPYTHKWQNHAYFPDVDTVSVVLIILHKVIYLRSWGTQILETCLPWTSLDIPGGTDSKASGYNVGDPGSIPGLGRSPGEENGNPLQHSCLENPMDRETW